MSLAIPALYLLLGICWQAALKNPVMVWLHRDTSNEQSLDDWIYLLGSTGFLAMLLDYQQRHRQLSKTELALRRSEEHYRQAVENSPNPIFAVNREGRIQTWNRACERVFQYTSAEVLGNPYSELLAPSKAQGAIAAAVATVFAGQSLNGMEVVYCCRDGSERFMFSRLYPLFDAQGVAEGCVFANTDITARYQAETQLQLLNQNLEARVEQRTAELRASLEEKELLLKEVHHRVKNNLQVISSLFSLQAQSLEDPQVLSILTDSQNRINTMALIHEKLYQSNALSQIDFREYIRNLAHDLIAVANLSPHQIQLELQVDEITLDLDTAIRCGLIINELISNALKHGFPNGQTGQIILWFHRIGEGQLYLKIQDTGVGLPENFNQRLTQSLGLRLVRILVRKLKGNLEIFNELGTTFEIIFPGS